MPIPLPATSRRQQIGLAGASCVSIAAAWVVLPNPLLVIAGGLAPLAILFTLRFPFLLVLAFVIFSFFRLHEVFPALYPLRIPQFLALATLLSLAWNLFNGRIHAYWSRELSAFALFFSLVAIGVLFATNRAEALSSWSGTFLKIGVIVIAFAWLNRGPGQFKLAAYTIVLAGIAVGSVALSNKVAGIGLVEGTRVTIGRDIGSMLGDPNDLALVLLFPASFSLALLLTPCSGPLAKLVGSAGISVMLAAVVATQSRGGLLGLGAVIGVFAYRRIPSKTLFAALAVIALALLFALSGISERASGGAHEEGIDESAMGRLHAWGAAINMALSHPFAGVGINNFIANYFQYSDFWDGQNHAVHSTWFGVLAETGLVGFAAFLLMIYLIVRCASNAQRQLAQLTTEPAAEVERAPLTSAYIMAQATFSGLIGFMVSGTFLTMGFTWPLYILIGLAVSTGRYSAPIRSAAKKYIRNT